jgi:hypothetical protein
MHRSLSLIASGLLGLAFVTGCGSAASPVASSSAATQAKADFVAKANAICAAGNQQVAALGAAPGDPSAATAAELPAWGTYVGGVTTSLANNAPLLAALPGPDQSQDQATAGAILANLATLIKDGAAAEASAKAGDLTAFQAAMATLATDSRTANTAAAAFGLGDCAK